MNEWMNVRWPCAAVLAVVRRLLVTDDTSLLLGLVVRGEIKTTSTTTTTTNGASRYIKRLQCLTFALVLLKLQLVYVSCCATICFMSFNFQVSVDLENDI